MRSIGPQRRGAPLRLSPCRPAPAAHPARGGRAHPAKGAGARHAPPIRRLVPLGLVGGLLTLLPLLVGAQGAGPGGTGTGGAAMDTLARGRAIFVATCRSCHTVRPPGQGAPPMGAIARRYRTYSGSVVAAQSRIAAWLFRPDPEQSLLPKAEREKYGLMPHQPLADAGRFAVAAYVVTLADSMPRRGRGAGPPRR